MQRPHRFLVAILLAGLFAGPAGTDVPFVTAHLVNETVDPPAENPYKKAFREQFRQASEPEPESDFKEFPQESAS